MEYGLRVDLQLYLCVLNMIVLILLLMEYGLRV